MQHYTIRPVVLAHKANTQGIASIRIAVTVNRKVTYMATEHRVHTTQWSDDKRQVVNHENAALINISLRRRIAEIERDLINRNLDGVPINKKTILGDITTDRAFIPFAREVSDNAKEIKRLEAYAGKEIMLSEITVTFLRKYEEHERKRGMANNTTNTTFKWLRRVMNQAMSEKLIRENPFSQYDIPRYQQTDRVYLTEAELKQLVNHVSAFTGSMRTTALYFLMGCYSGLRHSDWMRFDYDSMVENGYMKLRAKKNKKFVVLPIGKTLAKVLKQVRELPPPMSNQKCNVMLKAIGASAGIKKELTTHVGRHTFGCLCASNKIPKSVTAELMGVSTSTVEVYYHLTGENIKQQAAVLRKL